MAKKKGLGRGLDALLSRSIPETTEAEKPAGQAHAEAGVGEANRLRDLPVDLIDRGRFQPRTRFEQGALEELAESVRSQGVIQPVVVRPKPDGRYELIAGERRWRAAQLAELTDVPAVVREVDDEETLALALIENIQREDLSPLEEALALARLIDEFDLTHEGAARAVGRSRAAVSNLLRLLDLAPAARELLDERKLEMGHARALLALDETRQGAAAHEVVAKGLSVRETEALVRRLKAGPAATKSASARNEDPDVRRLQTELSEQLGASVRIQAGTRGKGRLVIDYASLEQLDGILEKIRGPRDD